MKLKNNLYLLSGGVYGQLGNVLAVKHEEGCFLVDCGNPGSFHTIVENLNYWGLSEREVTHVLLTHIPVVFVTCVLNTPCTLISAPDKSAIKKPIILLYLPV